ncbi:MAG TPA: WecB/TagA/CpsF family glycosyltransferase [Alphaproteobacteria bacterium]|jgi:N-acetylglucosaminyldiphosphoundecaprenol N-acetyl-beta-D-mannosaminyltransferase|nr:WecB/TagA/CpsF family glycosyltransferase [Alphaproteobacteria bacterium]
MEKNKKNDYKKGLVIKQIMGINVLSASAGDVLTSIEQNITHSNKFYVVTPNPELVLSAAKDPILKKALNSADFPVPDGVGLKLAIPNLNIIKGRELFLELIKLAQKNNWKVFLLGGLDNESEIVAKKFGFEFAGGAKITSNLSKDLVNRINKFKPDLLFVAFGNPKQEIFIYENINKLNVKGMMAVGGTFRYIAGLSKLPPKWMEKIGLEWLWRLITEPFRFKRIWNAVVVFPLQLFWYKLTNS